MNHQKQRNQKKHHRQQRDADAIARAVERGVERALLSSAATVPATLDARQLSPAGWQQYQARFGHAHAPGGTIVASAALTDLEKMAAGIQPHQEQTEAAALATLRTRDEVAALEVQRQLKLKKGVRPGGGELTDNERGNQPPRYMQTSFPPSTAKVTSTSTAGQGLTDHERASLPPTRPMGTNPLQWDRMKPHQQAKELGFSPKGMGFSGP